MMEYGMVDHPEHQKLKNTERHLLILISWYDGNGDGCYRSAQSLAYAAGLSRRQTIRILKSLEEKGIISCEYRGRTSPPVRRLLISLSDIHNTSDASDTTSDNRDTSTSDSSDTTLVSPVSLKVNISKQQANKKYTITFEEFWSKYPKKAGKAAAAKVFNRLSPEDQKAAVTGAEKYYEERRGEDVKFTKMAQGWLNDRRWEDEQGSGPASTLDMITSKLEQEIGNELEVRTTDEDHPALAGRNLKAISGPTTLDRPAQTNGKAQGDNRRCEQSSPGRDVRSIINRAIGKGEARPRY